MGIRGEARRVYIDQSGAWDVPTSPPILIVAFEVVRSIFILIGEEERTGHLQPGYPKADA